MPLRLQVCLYSTLLKLELPYKYILEGKLWRKEPRVTRDQATLGITEFNDYTCLYSFAEPPCTGQTKAFHGICA